MDASEGRAVGRRSTVAVVDDVDQIRQMLVRGIGRSTALTVVGEAADFPSAFDLLEAANPDIALVDRAMDGADPVAAFAELRARFPGTSVVLLSGTPAEHVETDVLRLVDAFADKLAPLADTVALLEAVAEGRRSLAGDAPLT